MAEFLDKKGFAHAWDKIKTYVDTKVSGIISEWGGGNSDIPSGFIGIWSGNQVPDGWHICDGTNGTPDLTSKFVLGATPSIIKNTGGSNTVTLSTDNLPSHKHSLPTTITIPRGYSGGVSYPEKNYLYQGSYASLPNATPSYVSFNTPSSDTGSVGSGKSFNILPPYYALYYIMKL